jgi:hypothetical protein
VASNQSKRRPHFKTRKILERTKIWSWIPRWPETKDDCAGEDQLKFTGLNLTMFAAQSKTKPDTENIRVLSLAAAKFTTAQVTKLPM